MNMKKLLIVAMVLVLAVSCSTRLPYKDAGLVGNVIEKDYEVLGPVSVSGTVHNVLGFIQWGGFGYNDILESSALKQIANPLFASFHLNAGKFQQAFALFTPP